MFHPLPCFFVRLAFGGGSRAGVRPLRQGRQAGASQDGNQSERGEWALRLFDKFRRETVVAIVKASEAEAAALQSAAVRVESTLEALWRDGDIILLPPTLHASHALPPLPTT